MKRILFIVATFLIISGCATQAVKLSEAKNVSPDKVYFSNEQGENVATITFIRDSGFTGGGCLAHIYIDGQLAVGLLPSEKVSFKIKEGEHIFGLTLRTGGGCNFGVDIQEKDFRIKAGEHKFYRAFVDSNGTPSIAPTTQAQ